MKCLRHASRSLHSLIAINDDTVNDKLNAFRYVGCYVAKMLLKRNEQKTGDVYLQYVTCLGEMAKMMH